MTTPADHAAAVWADPVRTLAAGSAGAPATPAEVFAAAVWAYPDRTLTPPDFWEALVAFWRADPVLAAAFPGGLVHAEAAPAQAFPYARLWELEDQEPESPDDLAVTAAISAYGRDDQAGTAGDEAARAAGRVLMARLKDGANRPVLRFLHDGQTWRDAGVLWEPPGKLTPVGRSGGGGRAWRYDLWFRFLLVREV